MRDTAKQVADGLRGCSWASQVVLNFKEGPPAYILTLDRDMVTDYGLRAVDVANTLRWSMYGPVALKWFEPDAREIDLRLQSGLNERGDFSAIERTSILGSRAAWCRWDSSAPSIRNGLLPAFFALSAACGLLYRPHSLRSTAAVVKNLEVFLASVTLPPGYAFRIDREIYDRLEQFKTLTVLLIAALVLVFITLAAQMESLSAPLLVMSIVPVALSVPLGFLWLTHVGIDVPVIVSLIIMTGIIVNNAILVLDRILKRCANLNSFSAGEVRRSLRYAVRRRTRALFLTSATTILGVTPFLLGASSGSELFRPLAIVVFWGTLASAVATFLVLPAIAAAAPVLARRFPAVRASRTHRGKERALFLALILSGSLAACVREPTTATLSLSLRPGMERVMRIATEERLRSGASRGLAAVGLPASYSISLTYRFRVTSVDAAGMAKIESSLLDGDASPESPSMQNYVESFKRKTFGMTIDRNGRILMMESNYYSPSQINGLPRSRREPRFHKPRRRVTWGCF